MAIPKSAKQAAQDDGLEWWERQGKGQDRIRLRSSTFPAQTRANEPSNSRTPSSRNPNRPKTPPLNEAWASAPQKPIIDGGERERELAEAEELQGEPPDTPPARRNFKLRSGAIRNEDVMRQLSAMRERLNKEQDRVKSALNHRDYNVGIFDGDNDAVPPADSLLRQRDDLDRYVKDKGIRMDRDKPKHRIYLREHSDFDIHMPPDQRGNHYPPAPKNSMQPYFDRYGKPVIPAANGYSEANGSADDHPLVQLIKNSRTSMESAYPPVRPPNPHPSQLYGASRAPKHNRLNRSMSIETLDVDNPQKVVDDYLHRRDLKPRKDRRLIERADSSDSLYR